MVHRTCVYVYVRMCECVCLGANIQAKATAA